MNKSVTFIKCRPQEADAWPIAEKYKIAFIGYPICLKKDNVFTKESDFRNEILDISIDEWRSLVPTWYNRAYKQQITSNANLVKKIGRESFILVPRSKNGKCHIGLVGDKYKLVSKADWDDDYLNLREAQGLSSEYGYVSDVVQVFPIDEWRSVPFTLVPAWIRYRLLSRNTAGVIDNLSDGEGNSYETVKLLFESAKSGNYKFMMEDQSTERRLLDWIGPNKFEHLIVDLLQLESNKSVIWHHIGGSGDGGVDGLAINDEGQIIGSLQCKWHYGGSIREIEMRLLESALANGWKHVVIAVLHGTQEYTTMNHEIVEFWNREKVAELVEKHKWNLPCAKEIGLWNK